MNKRNYYSNLCCYFKQKAYILGNLTKTKESAELGLPIICFVAHAYKQPILRLVID